jgi:alpha-L-rhamnosidase
LTPAWGSTGLNQTSTPLQSERELVWKPDIPEFPIDLAVGLDLSFRLPEIAQAFHMIGMEAEAGSLLEVVYGLPHRENSGSSTYIARSGMQTYMGGDTFAFSELRLRLKSGRMRLNRVAAFEVRYPFERVASFACSDPMFDQLWRICARSLEVLSEDSYVDCADRERVEWTDDSPPAFDCTRVMMRGPDEQGKTHWGDARLLRGLLRRIALTQQVTGMLKAHSCSERFDIHAIMEDRSCDWIVLLREYCESTGDLELGRELWPTLTRLLDWYRKRLTARGLVLAREWEVWDNPLRYELCEGAGLNAMVYRALVDASALSESMGNQNDATALAREARRLQTDFNQLLWNEEEGAYDGALFGPGSEVRPQMGQPFAGTITNGRFHPTSQANLFAIYAGIVPPERVMPVRKWILNHLDEVHEPMSYFYLFQMLYAMEDTQQDLQVLKLMKVAWKKQIQSEWQTSWEEFEEGGSKIHIYGIHPAYFLTSKVLGARREGPFKDRTILIEPRFSGLEWAKGLCVTEFGPVEMDWKLGGAGRSDIICTIPQNVRARLRLREQGESTLLIINGKSRSVRGVSGWLETDLLPGRNTIRLQAAVSDNGTVLRTST